MSKIVELIQSVLESRTMNHHFQPIWQADGETLLGFEALARFDDFAPDTVFDAAVEAGLGVALDRLSLREAMRQGQPLPGYLFLNINPNHLGQSEGPFGSVGSAVATFRNRHAVVMELTEQRVCEPSMTEAGILRMHRRGIPLALDDAGTAQSTPQRLAWIRPRYVKIARPVIEAWRLGNEEELRRWIQMAADLKAELVAEGIEEAALVRPLAALGIHYFQGYDLGRPDEAQHWKSRLHERKRSTMLPALNVFTPPDWPEAEQSLSPLLSVQEIGDIMYSLWPVPAIVLDHNNRIVGMNLRAERHFGTSLEHVALQAAEEVLGLSGPEPGLTHASAILPGDLPVGESLEQRVVLHRTDGKDVPAQLTMVGIRIGNRPGLYKLFTFIPEGKDTRLSAFLGRDPLSGLPTRAWWEREMPSFHDAAGSVIFLDVDGLKQVNDLFGHGEGDRVLTDAGRVIRHMAETHDAVAVRYGGDEFLIVLPNQGSEKAHELADLLSRQFSQLEEAGSRVPATFSDGVAAFSPGKLREAIALADRQLYENKGLLLSSQAGGRLMLTASGRRALWEPIRESQTDRLSADRLAHTESQVRVRQRFVDFIDPVPDIAVAEVNAGRGQLGFLGGLATRVGDGAQYLAIDHQGSYLSLLYRQWQAGGRQSGVHFLRAASDHVPIVSQSADLSAIAFALPQERPEATLKEMVRITRPDGLIAVAYVASANLSEALNVVWKQDVRPRPTMSKELMDELAENLALTVVRQSEHADQLGFDTGSHLSVWMASLGLESHQLLDLPTPRDYTRRDAYVIRYETHFWLFRCPRY